MTQSISPQEMTKLAHRDYYAHGGYDDDRYRWTIDTFLPSCSGKRILEIGCGDGKLLRLLSHSNEVFGIEASESGAAKCRAEGLAVQCADVGHVPLDFPADYFDVVIILETFEHLMNPYYALLQIRRVLRQGGTLICSVPNPWSGHPYLYPGLFQFRYFREFLQDSGFRIIRIKPWQWVARETILPRPLRNVAFLKSRYVAGGLRRVVEKVWRIAGAFPWFCYWLWTFECVNENKAAPSPLERQVAWTAPSGIAEGPK